MTEKNRTYQWKEPSVLDGSLMPKYLGHGGSLIIAIDRKDLLYHSTDIYRYPSQTLQPTDDKFLAPMKH